MIHFLNVDKMRNPALRELADDYLRRIKRYVPAKETEIKVACRKTAAENRECESSRLLEACGAGAYVIVLDERGENPPSELLASRLDRQLSLGRDICLLIGGAYGHTNALRGRADWLLSLSAMTLVHEMARVFLYEQVYRAMTILRGEPYHK